jgi:hypothetical protein
MLLLLLKRLSIPALGSIRQPKVQGVRATSPEIHAPVWMGHWTIAGFMAIVAV